MPIRYAINGALKLVYAIGVDQVSLADLKQHMDELASDPAYRSPMKKLVDYRSGPVIRMDGEETRELTQYKLRLAVFAGERCAFVVTHDTDFGMSRLHGAHVDRLVSTNVFRTLDAALEWLDVDRDAFQDWVVTAFD